MIINKNFNKFKSKINYKKKLKSAFTIVEIVIVLLIFFTIGILIYSNFFKISLDYNYLKNDSELIVQILNEAKQKAILFENSSNWSVYFENLTSSDNIYLFSGDSFSTSGFYKKYTLNYYNRFIYPPENSTTKVVFSKFSGYTSTNTQIIIKNIKSNNTSTIIINYFGSIDYSIK
ncbi:MAG: hypothetical protein KatS3mg094_342 [Candidatus Parcubacteria bacterium]|nr:MAG: hypothetical protein KatS3mg094_342 [Candidatus Parcubacteria bacterium]